MGCCTSNTNVTSDLNKSHNPDDTTCVFIEKFSNDMLYDYLVSIKGNDWLRNRQGLNWLKSEKAMKWFLTDVGCAWHISDASAIYRKYCDKYLVEWLLSDKNSHILFNEYAYKYGHTCPFKLLSLSNVLVGYSWIRSSEALCFLKSAEGGVWLRRNYVWILRDIKWLHDDSGIEFLISDNGAEFIKWFIQWRTKWEGHFWLLTSGGYNWLSNGMDDYLYIFDRTR